MRSFIYLFVYLFTRGRPERGAAGGGGCVIAVYTAFPRYYCLWLCFLFPSRVLISWSCWLAGRRVSGVKAEKITSWRDPGNLNNSPLYFQPSPSPRFCPLREERRSADCRLLATGERGTDFLFLKGATERVKENWAEKDLSSALKKPDCIVLFRVVFSEIPDVFLLCLRR